MNLNTIPKELLLKMYTMMEEIRQFELRAVELYQAGEIPGFIHSCLGQEAAEVGMIAALKPEDYILTTHRGHGHVIAKGTDLNAMMAELYAKIDGSCRGKGGSMHIMDRSKNILGANGIVGAGTALGTGAALAAKIRGTDQVTVSFFGDGAQNEGVFHESMNLASIWDLPVIFFCENNLYAESTSQKYHMRPKDIVQRAKAYEVPGYIVDGNDVIDVYKTAKEAVELCRSGKGPILIEAKTYRWLGHYVGDPGVYRPEGEVEHWRSEERDAILSFRKRLIEEGLAKEGEIESIKEEVSKRIEESVEFARNSNHPELSVALENVYKEGLL